MMSFARSAGLIGCVLSLVGTVACSSSKSSGGGGDGGIQGGGLATTGFTSGVGSGSSTTTGGSMTGGAGGSSGTSTNCLRACAKLDGLQCPQDTPGRCATGICGASICHSQIEALALCVLRAAVACDANGQASTNDCDAEAIAVDDCANAGGP